MNSFVDLLGEISNILQHLYDLHEGGQLGNPVNFVEKSVDSFIGLGLVLSDLDLQFLYLLLGTNPDIVDRSCPL